jgi:hypothetical protein
MKNPVQGFGLAASLVLFSTLGVLPQARAQSTSSTAAYVYIQIQGPAGAVYGFSASSTGQLTAIPGAPWKPAGEIIGSNKSQFFTQGEDLIHSYGMASDGALESQLSQVPVLDYAGSGCGGAPSALDGAELDHTGKYMYVLLEGGKGADCIAYQSYKINTDGSFLFDGDTEQDVSPDWSLGFNVPSILGNETFGYEGYESGPGEPALASFRRESSGTLELMQFNETNPTISGNYYVAQHPDAAPTGNFVVLQLYPGDSIPGQLGSFTVDSEGNLTTTNTSSNMPTMALGTANSTFSPSGNLFVTYFDNNGTSFGSNGIQIFNFNGGASLTPYKTLLSGTPIDQVAWDSSNHLYAISKTDNELYVFTVTPTSVTQDAAWSIGSPYQMVVVSE